MRRLTSSIAVGLIAAALSPLASLAQVRLRATPQKFRAFYESDDTRIPARVRARLRHSQQRAGRSGIGWKLEADALIRETPPTVRLSFNDGLPVGRLRAITIATDGAVWAGGGEGLVRYQPSRDDWERWQYFAGRRYLPSDEVT